MTVALTPLLHASSESFLEECVATRPLVMHFEDIEYYVQMRGGKIKHVLCNAHGMAAPHEQTHQVCSPCTWMPLNGERL